MIGRVLLLSMSMVLGAGSLCFSDPAAAQDARRYQADPRFRREPAMQPGYPAAPGADRRLYPQPRPGGEDWAPEGRQGRRMTPEERQQLRRDIFDAGRDAYRPRQEWRGRLRRD